MKKIIFSKGKIREQKTLKRECYFHIYTALIDE